jgi:hypothetical protein
VIAGSRGRDPGQVRGRVDVVGAAGVTAFDQGDEVRTGAQECPGTLVAGGRRDHLGPVLPGQEHGVARLAVVGGHRHAGAVAVGSDQPGDRFRADQRLVGQGHDDRADIGAGVGIGQSPQGGPERGAHAGPPLWVVDGMRSVELDRRGTGDDQDRVRAASPQEMHAALGESLAVQLHQRLGPAEPGSFTRGEQDARDRRAHGV